MYVRNSVTQANEDLNPIQLDENSEQFKRLARARTVDGEPLFAVDPRGVQWYFGARNLPLGQQSMAFGDRVYLAWDYDDEDPVLTRVMAYELTRIMQQNREGGELAFARLTGSYVQLLDAADGRQSRLKRERDAAVRAWHDWWTRFSAAGLTVTDLTPAQHPQILQAVPSVDVDQCERDDKTALARTLQ